MTSQTNCHEWVRDKIQSQCHFRYNSTPQTVLPVRSMICFDWLNFVNNRTIPSKLTNDHQLVTKKQLINIFLKPFDVCSKIKFWFKKCILRNVQYFKWIFWKKEKDWKTKTFHSNFCQNYALFKILFCTMTWFRNYSETPLNFIYPAFSVLNVVPSSASLIARYSCPS